MPWIAHHPLRPKSPLQELSRCSHRQLLMKPLVAPFSIARPTRAIGVWTPTTFGLYVWPPPPRGRRARVADRRREVAMLSVTLRFAPLRTGSRELLYSLRAVRLMTFELILQGIQAQSSLEEFRRKQIRRHPFESNPPSIQNDCLLTKFKRDLDMLLH